MRIKIEVKKKHIEEGKKWECRKCPVALALLDAGFKDVDVSGLSISLRPKGWSRKMQALYKKLDSISLEEFEKKEEALDNATAYISASNKVMKFVDSFDEGKAVKPFSFTLSIPKEKFEALTA